MELKAERTPTTDELSEAACPEQAVRIQCRSRRQSAIRVSWTES